MRIKFIVVFICLFVVIQAPAMAQQNEPERKGTASPRVDAKSAEIQKRLTPRLQVLLEPRSSRWGILSEAGLFQPSIFDPYNQNVIKGDFPIFGDQTFMIFTNVFVPKAVFNNQENAETQFNNAAVTSLEFFRGATVFKPKDWSIKGSAKTIFNRGNNKDVTDVALLELFGELKLFDVGRNFDFTATRNGFQFFKTDFNGLIFQDFNLGYQLFGELGQNRFQWSLAFVDLRAKQNGLLTFETQNQDVFFANWFWEDFLRPGFNTVFSLHLNRDQIDPLNSREVFYAGVASAGHWGRIVFNPVFYYAFGSEKNGGNSQSVSAFLTGVDIAYPVNFLNYRTAFFFASGDSDPADGKATGFASINENINLFGAGNSFLIGGNAFNKPNSFIPSNQGVSPFVNPGVLFFNTGLDIVLTPKLFMSNNFNIARFANTTSLEATENKNIGFEVNAAFNYRLFLNENFVIQLGANAFFPGSGGADILGSNQTVFTGNFAIVTVF